MGLAHFQGPELQGARKFDSAKLTRSTERTSSEENPTSGRERRASFGRDYNSPCESLATAIECEDLLRPCSWDKKLDMCVRSTTGLTESEAYCNSMGHWSDRSQFLAESPSSKDRLEIAARCGWSVAGARDNSVFGEMVKLSDLVVDVVRMGGNIMDLLITLLGGSARLAEDCHGTSTDSACKVDRNYGGDSVLGNLLVLPINFVTDFISSLPSAIIEM